ncbi:MAG: hypothetical protein JWN94_781 [Betaproteobacteria bacterium]|nr:hypothetical protein [Betaproteobacteria bacterium]
MSDPQTPNMVIWHLSPTVVGARVWTEAPRLVIVCARDELDAREFALQGCAPYIDVAATQINFLKLANFWRDEALSNCHRERSGQWPSDKQGILFPLPLPPEKTAKP